MKRAKGKIDKTFMKKRRNEFKIKYIYIKRIDTLNRDILKKDQYPPMQNDHMAAVRPLLLSWPTRYAVYL